MKIAMNKEDGRNRTDQAEENDCPRCLPKKSIASDEERAEVPETLICQEKDQDPP